MQNNEVLSLLVVDDEKDLQDLFTQKFRKEIRAGALQFHFAHNGVSALETLGNNKQIAMVVSDINMPEMDGLTLLDAINHDYPDVMTIVLSAYGDMSNIRAAMNLGAFDFLTKPINFDDLSITINKTNNHIKQVKEAQRNQSRLTKILDELHVASNIQNSILPKTYFNHSCCQIFGYMRPAREVGGDFYDYFSVDETHVGFVVGDVSGKGVPAALFMSVTRTLVRAYGSDQLSPEKCIKKVSDTLLEDNNELMFVTIFYGVLNLVTGQLTFTNAGHEPPLLVKKDGEVIDLLGGHGVVAGIRKENHYENQVVQLSEGDTLLIFTDGVTDAGSNDEEFSREHLTAALKRSHNLPANVVISKIHQEVDALRGQCAQYDDMTLMVLRYEQQHIETQFSCANAQIKLELRNTLDDIEKTINDIENFFNHHHAPDDIIITASLVLNEVLANILSYAYNDDKEHVICIEIHINNGKISLTIIDDGIEFNPVDMRSPDVTLPLEERGVGGLGVYLFKSFVDHVTYERRDGLNRLNLVKNIKGN